MQDMHEKLLIEAGDLKQCYDQRLQRLAQELEDKRKAQLEDHVGTGSTKK